MFSTLLKKNIIYACCLLIFWGCDKIPDDRALVISGIRDAAKLSTLEFVVSKVVIAEKTAKPNIFGTASIIIYTEATIKAGVDLGKIRDQDIRIYRDTIKISLPQAEILHFSYPPDKFVLDTIYSKDQWLVKIDKAGDTDKLLRETQIKILDGFEESNQLEKVNAKTASFLRTFLAKAGYTKVEIAFKPDTLTNHN